MFCSRCGAQVSENVSFCPDCGNAIVHRQETLYPIQNQVVAAELPEPSHETVIEHLTYAAELEKSVYFYQRLWERIQQRIQMLGHSTYIEKPTPLHAEDFLEWWLMVPLAISWVISYFTENWLLLCVCVLFVLVRYFVLFAEKQAERAEYLKRVEEDRQRVLEEQAVIAQLKKQQQEIMKQTNETRTLLKRVYAIDILFPKYRNMVAVLTILEYFQAGRCDTLRGRDGAYNLFSSEEMQKVIISRLDCVVQQLESVKQSQYMLYQAVSETNVLLGEIYGQNEELIRVGRQIEANTAMMQYHSANAERNTRISAYVDRERYIRM